MDNTPIYGYMKNTSNSFLEELGGNSLSHSGNMVGPGPLPRDCHPQSGPMSMHSYGSGRADSTLGGSNSYMNPSMNPMQSMQMGSSNYPPHPQQYYETPGPYMGSNKMQHPNMVSSMPGVNSGSVSRNNWSMHSSYQNMASPCGNPPMYHHPHLSTGANNPVMGVSNTTPVQYPQSNSSNTVGWHPHPSNNPNNAANNSLYYSHSQHPSMQYVPGTNVTSYLPGVNIPPQNYPSPMVYRSQPGQQALMSGDVLNSPQQQYNSSINSSHPTNTFSSQDVHCATVQPATLPSGSGVGSISNPQQHHHNLPAMNDPQIVHGSSLPTPAKTSNNHPNPLQQLSVMTSQISYAPPVSHASQVHQQAALTPQQTNEAPLPSHVSSSKIVSPATSESALMTHSTCGSMPFPNDKDKSFLDSRSPVHTFSSSITKEQLDRDIHTPEDIHATLTMDVIADGNSSFVEDTGLNTPPALSMDVEEPIVAITYSTIVDFTPSTGLTESVPHCSPPVSVPSSPILPLNAELEKENGSSPLQNEEKESLDEPSEMEDTQEIIPSTPVEISSKKRKRCSSGESLDEARVTHEPDTKYKHAKEEPVVKAKHESEDKDEPEPIQSDITESDAIEVEEIPAIVEGPVDSQDVAVIPEIEKTEIESVTNGDVSVGNSSPIPPSVKDEDPIVECAQNIFEEEPFLPAPPAKRPRPTKKRSSASAHRKKPKTGFVGSQRSYYGEGGDSDFEESNGLNTGTGHKSIIDEAIHSTATSDSESAALVNGLNGNSDACTSTNKRRSSRAAASNKHYNVDAALAFSGDEGDNDEDTASSQDNVSMSTVQEGGPGSGKAKATRSTPLHDNRGDEVVEIESKVVEKILGKRIGKRPKRSANNKDTSKDDVNPEEEVEEDVEEFYLKYKAYSYLHCEWKPLDEIEDPRILAKVKRYRSKNGPLDDDDDEELFNPDYVEVDRVLDMRVLQEEVEIPNETNTHENDSDTAEESNDSSLRKTNTIDVTYYLVKWRSLPYEEATWELAQDVDPNKVKEHMRWRDQTEVTKTLSSTAYGPGEKPKSSEWNPSEQSRRVSVDRVYRNGNQLRAYQVEGVNWLTFCWYHRRNCILADEMGLGKTVQSIAFLTEVFSTGVRGPFLVLVPLSTLGNWQREFENWTDMNVLVYHGSALSRQMIQQYDMFYGSKGPPFSTVPSSSSGGNRRSQAQLQQWTKQCKFHALITTYEVLMNDIDFFSRFLWRVAIIDEAHRLKNKKCKLHEGLSCLDLEHRVLLTGTPLQNNVEELFSLLNFLNPTKFPSAEVFLSEFGDLKTEDQVAKLQHLLKPMMLRRLKEDVEKSIAPKEETIIEVELTNIQKRYYRAILEKNYKYLCKGATHSNAPNLVNTMMELRKCCNHPYLIRHAEENIMNEMKEMQMQLYREREDTNKSESLVSSIVVPVSPKAEKSSKNSDMVHSDTVPDSNSTVESNQDTAAATTTTGAAASSSSSISQNITDMNYNELQLHTLIYASGKLVLVHKLLPRLKEEGHKVLIFSQMTRVLDILEDYLLSQKFLYERLDGGITGEKRQEAIDRFCNDPSKFVFILCTKAGGLGINLTAADVVIIYDSDWNPQNDLQAQARCHRIGQSKMVKVYRLITRNTYEREMFDKASMKLGLDKAILQSMGSKETKKAQPTKKEVEELLKKGAYGALMDDDRAGEDFCEEDIDNILQRRSHVVQIDGAAASTPNTASVLFGQSTFSKASFSVSDNRNDIDIDDPNFWSKWAKDAGLDEQSLLAEQNLIVDEPRQRRQTNRYVADSGYDYSENASNAAANCNNVDHSNGTNGQGGISASGVGLTGGGRASDDDSSLMGGEDGCRDDAASGAQAQGAIIDGEVIDRVDMFKIEKSLLTWGWSRWQEILTNTPLKCSNIVTTEQIARLCWAVIHYAVCNYNGDPRIASFVSYLLRPNTGMEDMHRHLGMSAPVARGRRCRGGVETPQRSVSELNEDAEVLKDLDLPPSDERVKLLSDGFKKHLKRASNRILHRVQALYFLQHQILGPGGHADRIKSGASFTQCRLLNSDTTDSACGIGGNNIYRRLDSMEKPSIWWDREADESLLLGVFKHGCEKYEAMRADPQLCFLHKCGPPFGVQLAVTNTLTDATTDSGTVDNEKMETEKETVKDESESVAKLTENEEPHLEEEKLESNLNGESSQNVLPFPSTTDMNSRFRRLIAFFQRIKHQEDNDVQKSKRRAHLAQSINTLPMCMPVTDSCWLAPRDIKWSRREEADFYRVVCTYGVERLPDSDKNYNGIQGYHALYAWDNFRNFSAITKKSDAALTAYYEAFRFMCRSVTNQLTPDECSPNDVKVSAISSERAAKCLHKIDLLSKVREDVLNHPFLEERLKLCQRSPDLPDWWVPIIHDLDLLRGVAKFGLGHCESNILLDPELNFYQTVQLIEKKVFHDPQVHEKIATYGIGSSASTLAASVAMEIKAKLQPVKEELSDVAEVANQTTEEESIKKEADSNNENVDMVGEKMECETKEDPEPEPTAEDSGNPPFLVESKAEESEVVESNERIDEPMELETKSGEEVATPQKTEQTETDNPLVESESNDNVELPWPRTANISALINCAIAWPKDRSVLNRIEAVIHCVEFGEWPFPRRYLGTCHNLGTPAGPSTSTMWVSPITTVGSGLSNTGMPQSISSHASNNTPACDLGEYNSTITNRSSGLDHILSSHDMLGIVEKHSNGSNLDVTNSPTKYVTENPKKAISNTELHGESTSDPVTLSMEQQLMAQFLQSFGLDNFGGNFNQPTAMGTNVATPTLPVQPTTPQPPQSASTTSGRAGGRGRGRSKAGSTVATTPRSQTTISSSGPTKAQSASTSGGLGLSTADVADNETMAAMNALIVQYMTALASFNNPNATSVEEQQQQLLFMRSLLAATNMQQQPSTSDSKPQQQQQVLDAMLGSSLASAQLPSTSSASAKCSSASQQQPSRRGRKKKMEKLSSTSKAYGMNDRSVPSTSKQAEAAMAYNSQNQMDAATSAWLSSALSALGVPSLGGQMEASMPDVTSHSISKASTSNVSKMEPEKGNAKVTATDSSREMCGKWEVVVPVMNLSTSVLLDASDQAPKRKHLEQWLRDHPEFVPYSIEPIDQDIWNRVSRSRGDEACNLVELVQYHHYMSMMQAALASGTSVDGSLSQLQQQQQAASALAINQMLAHFMNMSQPSSSQQTSTMDATLSNIYAAASLNNLMGGVSRAPEAMDSTPKSNLKVTQETCVASSRKGEASTSASSRKDVDHERATPKRASVRSEKQSRKTSASPARGGIVSTSRQVAAAATSLVASTPAAAVTGIASSSSSTANKLITDPTENLQQQMSADDYNNYIAYQMMYALAYSNPLLYSQMLSGLAGPPPTGAAANEQSGSTAAATDQLLRDFSSYQQARNITSSFGDIAAMSGSTGTASVKSPTLHHDNNEPSTCDDASAVLDLSSKKSS